MMLRSFLCLLLALAGTATLPAEPVVAPAARTSVPPPDDPARIEMARVQIVLDRAGFRPGKIDGLGGEFTQKAFDRYARANGLEAGVRLDLSAVPVPYRSYTVTEEDLAWIGPMAANPPEQAKLKRLPYTDSWEAIAEKFHTDLDFVRELNPHLTAPPQPGDVVRVPDVEPFEMSAVVALEKQRLAEARARKIAADAAQGSPTATPIATPVATPTPNPEPKRRLVLLRDERLIELYEDDRLIGCFPCTPGSSKFPVPEGQWRIIASTLMPYFRWDKSVLETGKRSDEAYNLPPGPNNPVGIVWLALNIPSRGLHGTQSPDQIGRNSSSGCVRLANWDAWVLAQKVGKRTPVEVR